ncbi:hypothetical protein FE257_005294 [Aspergillus nanangensis]|uniref:Cytochrome P450 monooxygenase n=1 Tax=Aspergillus nanangensis TaxID=2582783 RepID=A0AAD4CQU6_ASPNN|nr:hypothetical protein FE257_005294 [Aspergillus nanangensis]
MMDTISEFLLDYRYLPVVILLVLYLLIKFHKSNDHDIPTVRLSRFLPDFVNRQIFFLKAPAQIQYGYDTYKDRPFWVLRPDSDLLVLPRRYLEEIRQISSVKMSPLEAQYNNILGQYTNILPNSELTGHTVARKLTPALNRILPRLLHELHHAFEDEIPSYKDWTPINLYTTILRLVSRTTSSIIVSNVTSCNEKWLETITTYSTNVGLTILCLRPVPRPLRPLVARFLPCVRNMHQSLRWVQDELIGPTILARREAEARNAQYRKPDDLLQWMMDSADNEYDRDPRNLAQALLIITALGAVHTSTSLITQVMYDLLARPEYIDVLREEVQDTLAERWINGTQASFAAQVKLDSVLRESLRCNPTSEVSTQRVAKVPFTFSDGFTVPKGAQICFPAGPMSRDNDLTPDALAYDAFRWCKNPKSTGTSLVSVGYTNIHFGYGRLACPGRFYAANTTKAILSRLLVEYDIEYQPGRRERPKHLRIGEQIMPSMSITVLIRERGVRV